MLKYLLRPLAVRSLLRISIQRIQPLSRNAAKDLPIDPPNLGVTTTKFNETDETKILQVINGVTSVGDLLEYDISKGRAEKIRSWQNKNGPFKSIDEMLELDGFGLKNLNKFCSSIVSDETFVNRLKHMKRSQQFTTPIITSEMRSRIESCTAIHIGITSISWAQFQLGDNAPTTLTDWSFNTIPENKMHISEFIESVQEIIERIPESDAYVFETPRVAHQGPQGTPATVNISIQMSQMAAMTAITMSQRRIEQKTFIEETNSFSSSKKRSQVLFCRQFLASRLFQTVVGTERISTATVVSSLIKDSENSRYNPPKNRPIAGEISLDPKWQMLYVSADGHCKEYLGQSLLMGLSFVRLCLLQCPHSLDLLRSRAKQNV